MTNSYTKKISAYISSGRIAATANYRIYQYLNKSKHDIKFRKKISERMYAKYMPISQKSLPIKIYCWFILYFRGLTFLILDLFRKPDIIILTRGMLPKFFPLSYSKILKRILKKSILIWDFDDNILELKEISRKKFNWFSKEARYIVVASEYNREMIEYEWRSKCVVAPTTDPDLFLDFNESLIQARMRSLETEVRLVWVGSASGLEHLMGIVTNLERFAKKAREQGKDVTLTVVCNKPLPYKPKYFKNSFVKWTREKACEEMKMAHIGIMPLFLNEITKGKGGFKLIQYLSIGLPVIGSAVGINNDIITPENGMIIDNYHSSKWEEALEEIAFNSNNYKRLSKGAYNHWNKYYSYSSNQEIWNKIINN